MEKNPGDTPNPLNPIQNGTGRPTLEVNTPSPQPVNNTVVDDFIKSNANHVAEEPKTIPVTEAIEETATIIEPVEVDDPITTRPMEKAPAAEVKPIKKNKTGLIIGAIVCLFVAIGCGVAAALLYLVPQTDPVAAALNKLFSGNAPANIVASGTIDLDTDSDESLFSNINIALNVSARKNSLINSTEATVTGTLRGGNDKVSISFNEVYAEKGDLYLKIEGATTAFEDLSTNLEITNQSSSDIIESLSVSADAIETIDGEWIRISSEDIEPLTSQYTEENTLSCVTNLINGTSQNSNSIAKFYQDYPFITSSSESLPIASKGNPIYQIKFNNDNLSKFIEATNNSNVTKELFSCMGYQNTEVNIDNLIEEINKLPDIYVEIDGNNDFTRIYFVAQPEGDISRVVVDISLSYPANINISEPTEYQDLTTVMQTLYSETTVTQE